MMDKRMTVDEVVSQLWDGMTLGIGGWGSRRKPMALVRAILRSPLRELTVVSYGGPDVGLLASAGKIRRLVFGFVTLDSIPFDPWFNRVREAGEIEVTEYDEGVFGTGLSAAAQRLPFLPTRAGLGSDVLRLNPHLRTVRSPYGDEELLAVPALKLDASLVHLNRADARGNAQYLGVDPYFDELFALAADRCYVSVEKIVDEFDGPVQTLLLNRASVHGVVETPHGAHFTTAAPDYGRDEPFQRHYVTSAKDPDLWPGFVDRFLSGDEASYQAAVAEFA
ncbi:CoA transferase subunit A [Amycolatopsis acidiphila]|uniref:CoA transferase subunit A n=1 Tax=Amycolatopsis acidiphila TaxID=715473 RepID=A0A558AEY9_9PSEU|nr:CoA-transferase [Amycolatopsis acidiphila]TVT22836.1 CoA transferase subunit A [Amycolatopsis acidiphila]UIJ58151.1 CoA transferase subunit A [Amycolatopsis acidiphila]